MEGRFRELNGYRVYSYRWVVLVAYLLITAMIQLLWATYFSIVTDAWKYYGFADAARGENAINLFSIIFMVGMIALSIPTLAAFEKWGFKKAVGFGAALMGACGLLRGVFLSLGQGFFAVALLELFLHPVLEPVHVRQHPRRRHPRVGQTVGLFLGLLQQLLQRRIALDRPVLTNAP